MYERQRNSRYHGGALRPSVWVALVAALVAPTGGRAAHADGAFPEAQSVMLPRDRADGIILATTFGLVSTDDGGQVWHWSCEAANTPMTGGGQYTMGPPPADRIYAKTDIGVALSTNAACTWSQGGGALASDPALTKPMPFDIFPDPADPLRVFVLATDYVDSSLSAFRSVDGGATYQGPIFNSPGNSPLTGIESAASAAGTVYLTLYQGPGVHPRLATSPDGGDTWTVADLEPQLGTVVPSLAAVDPVDPRKLYVRVVSGAGAPARYQGVAITTDGGVTWTIPLKVLGGSLSGFARLSDQRLLAVGKLAPVDSNDPGAPALFRSEDGGLTFSTEPLSFHPLGLAQRDGIAYVPTSDVVDGFGLASSIDGGHIWTPRLRFRDIHDIKECARATCANSCMALADLALFPPAVCTTATSAGCGCTLAPMGGGAGTVFGMALIALAALLAARRRPQERRHNSRCIRLGGTKRGTVAGLRAVIRIGIPGGWRFGATGRAAKGPAGEAGTMLDVAHATGRGDPGASALSV